MQLEKQVCNLQLAKKLKELGVKQESCFYWCTILGTDNEADLRPSVGLFGKEIDFGHNYGGEVSAFTVAELGEMLPDLYESYRTAGSKQWYCNLVLGARKVTIQYPNTIADTEADARSKMLIYLLENKLI